VSTGRLRQPERADGVEDVVVLLDDDGRATGTAPRAGVHGASTPLHLAFSCYLFQGSSLLLTRRSPAKVAFPGVWTNSVCGHPRPGEPLEDAVRRRARDELGADVVGLRLVLPSFRYRAGADGVEENEICPVLVGELAAAPRPDPAEVDQVALEPWEPFARAVLDGTRDVSPWCRLQVTELAALGAAPHDWATADPALLPPVLHA
jgi:isopentenyl-diphosphate delta-isomerase